MNTWKITGQQGAMFDKIVNINHIITKFAIFYPSSYSFFSSVGCADAEALTRLFQTSFLFVFWSLYPSPHILDIFLLQVLTDIIRPDSSCKSFLVSCQAVTNPLLVG